MTDVVIAGGGPAGALTALLLARGGARVQVFERATFPRHKLCGDTLNPGAVAVLARHLDLAPLMAQSDPIDGMLITGPRGVRVQGRYPSGLAGRAVTRRVLDHWLLSQAAQAGARIDEGATVKSVTFEAGAIDGVMVLRRNGGPAIEHARLVVAADGRRSALAFGRGLSRQPARPRRWAIGAYFTDVEGMTSSGEMHIRDGHYIGVAPVPGGLANVCLVVPHQPGSGSLLAPRELVARLFADPELAARFSRARLVDSPVMLGPMAVDSDAAGEPGLLLAGDAAGFIDPMTGDGLRLALASAEMAARVALEVLAGRLSPVRAHHELLAERQSAFGPKWRFNRTLRSLVASPRGVVGAAAAARVVPSLFEWMVRYAGDCHATTEAFV
ncbi:MAG: FAD-dependent monooxygenase [Vicinamibacterales bacterium]